MSLSVLTLIGVNTNVMCSLRVWVWSIGFDLAFGAVTLKLWRVWSIVEASMKFSKVALTARKMRCLLALLLFSDALILSLWTASKLSHVRTKMTTVTADVEIPLVECSTLSSGYFLAWGLLKIFVVVASCYVSFITRKLKSALAESGAVGLTVYNTGVVGILVSAVYWAGASAQICAVVTAVAVVLGGVGAMCTILAPKLWTAKQESRFIGATPSDPDIALANALTAIATLTAASPGMNNNSNGGGTREEATAAAAKYALTSPPCRKTLGALTPLVLALDGDRWASVGPMSRSSRSRSSATRILSRSSSGVVDKSLKWDKPWGGHRKTWGGRARNMLLRDDREGSEAEAGAGNRTRCRSSIAGGGEGGGDEAGGLGSGSVESNDGGVVTEWEVSSLPLVMRAETGTTLFCPHCDRQVAGCGFSGCSGSLVPPPSNGPECDCGDDLSIRISERQRRWRRWTFSRPAPSNTFDDEV
ncbi:unnamed protein product [Choristocarpus tenellus]